MPNNLKLFFLLIVGIFLSGYLFYEGLSLDLNSFYQELNGKTSRKQVLGETKTENETNFQKAEVKKVFDGDTIEVLLNGNIKSVRFIGIDTPETVDPRRPVGCFGKEASNETKRLLEGKTVYLEKDISETDKYDRLLRYIYLELGDGKMLFINDYLVRQGFGFASSFPPDVKYNDRFNEAQNEARENLRGLWDKCD